MMVLAELEGRGKLVVDDVGVDGLLEQLQRNTMYAETCDC